MDSRHPLKCDIYEFNRLRINVIDTLRFNNDADFLYRLAAVLEMSWTMNIGANAHDKQLSENHYKWQTQQLGFQS